MLETIKVPYSLKIIGVIPLIIVFFLVNSCSSETTNEPPISIDFEEKRQGERPYFSLGRTNIKSTSKETTFTIKIGTNSEWNVNYQPEWVTISHTKGNQSIELELTVTASTLSNRREGIVRFQSLGNLYELSITQEGVPIALVSFSGSDSKIKMALPKYLLFNEPIKLNSITSGSFLYNFNIREEDIEYFDDNKGVRFTHGSNILGSDFKYRYSVSDAEGNTLSDTIQINFYTQRIVLPNPISKWHLDADNKLWIMTAGLWEGSDPARIHRFGIVDDHLVEEMSFQLDINFSGRGSSHGYFTINPFNDLIYVSDPNEQEIEIYSKSGGFVKTIQIELGTNEHPQHPVTTPGAISFLNSGKGVIALGAQESTARRLRFIDSGNNDEITEIPDESPSYYNNLYKFFTSRDNSKIYMIDSRSTLINVFVGNEVLQEINIANVYPNDVNADVYKIVPNKKNDMLYIAGLYNQQIVSPDLSFLSNRYYSKSFNGDFSYDPTHENHVYGWGPESWLELLDFNNQETIFTYQIGSNTDIITTTDDKFIFTYSNNHDTATQESRITIYSTEMFK